MAKAAAKKPPTKTEILSNIAQSTDLTKKQVASVFEALGTEIHKAIAKRGASGGGGAGRLGRRVPRRGRPGGGGEQQGPGRAGGVRLGDVARGGAAGVPGAVRRRRQSLGSCRVPLKDAPRPNA